MAQRVKMDWILFGTILGLVAVGLVMVYSASSVMQELQNRTRLQQEAQAEIARVSLEISDNPDQAAPPAPVQPARPDRTGLLVLGGVIGLAGIAALLHRWMQGALPASWGVGGVFLVVALQVLTYSIATGKAPHYAHLFRQAAAALVGFGLLVLISQRDYRRFHSARWVFAGLGVVTFLLIMAYWVGNKQRWLNLGISIQPSEFAKPALILFLAWFLTRRDHDHNGKKIVNTKQVLYPTFVALTFVAGLVALADFGTAFVLAVTAITVLYLAGLHRKYLLAVGLAGVLLLSVAIAVKPYRVKRIIDFVDPTYKRLVFIDPQKVVWNYAQSGGEGADGGYQSMQSTIAIGAGGVWGRGIMQSRQKLLFLPEAHTDFIFAILAEELGLWGASGILLGFLVILWRGYLLYWTAADDFGRYLAAGVTTSVVFQAMLNMSVVLDLGPTKGIPLPLVSFGGSALLSSLILLAMLLSVSQRASHA